MNNVIYLCVSVLIMVLEKRCIIKEKNAEAKTTSTAAGSFMSRIFLFKIVRLGAIAKKKIEQEQTMGGIRWFKRNKENRQ